MDNKSKSNTADPIELPSAGQLTLSTIIAAVVAIAILVTIVLPAEYAIDLTGVGDITGLQRMGEIKKQLAEEAEEAETDLSELSINEENSDSDEEEEIDSEPVPETEDESEPEVKTETYTTTLKPDEGIEVKLEILKDKEVNYKWEAEGGNLNYDAHGDPYDKASGSSHSYSSEFDIPGNEGTLTAAFDGFHGWFWRNRSGNDVTLTLEVSGEFLQLKEIK